MVDLQYGPSHPVNLAANAVELSDAQVMRLLAAEDAKSIETLATWLKSNPKTFPPLVMQASTRDKGLSVSAAAAVLDGLAWRTKADEQAMLEVMETCLKAIAERITVAVSRSKNGAISKRDDRLVGAAVSVLTADRRSRQSEAAICCLGEAGTGGALILARAFHTIRGVLRLFTVRHLAPAHVLELDGNVVASLAESVSKLADELERPQKDVATKFLAALGSVEEFGNAEISATEPLAIGQSVFHARWGGGTVLAADAKTVTIDFGHAGTRTLLRELTTLRRAE